MFSLLCAKITAVRQGTFRSHEAQICSLRSIWARGSVHCAVVGVVWCASSGGGCRLDTSNLDKPPTPINLTSFSIAQTTFFWTSYLFLSRKQFFFENLFVRHPVLFYVQCTQIFYSFALRTKLTLFYSNGSISFAGIELVRTKSCFWCALAHNKRHSFLGCP